MHAWIIDLEARAIIIKAVSGFEDIATGYKAPAV